MAKTQPTFLIATLKIWSEKMKKKKKKSTMKVFVCCIDEKSYEQENDCIKSHVILQTQLKEHINTQIYQHNKYQNKHI